VTQSLDRLAELLDLEAIEVNIFRGKNLDETRLRVFEVRWPHSRWSRGSTVDSGRVHSLHSYFLRPGVPDCSDPLRGSTASATAFVYDAARGCDPARPAIFNLQCSFSTPKRAPARCTSRDARGAPAGGPADASRAPSSLIATSCLTGGGVVDRRVRSISEYVGDLPWPAQSESRDSPEIVGAR